MNKKVLLLFFSVLFIISAVSPLSAYALLRNGSGEAVLLQDGEFDIETSESVSFAEPVRGLSLDDTIYNALITCSDSFNIASFRISIDDISAVYSNTVNDHPDLFFVSSSFEYNYYQSNNNVAYIYPEYTMEEDEVEDALDVFNAGAAKALSIIDNSMNDVQKAVMLHDYVCELAHYPQVNLNTDDKSIYHSAYGLFYDGEIVCAGYTLIYSYLMNMAGVQCEYVSSDAMNHAWNKVKIGNYWYNVDCTWDDLDYSSPISIRGSVEHCHFLKSDSKFNTLDCSFHFGGATYDNCTATDTTYDSAFWDDITSRIYAVNGDFYYMDPDVSGNKARLVKRTVNGSETVLTQFSVTVVMNSSTTCWDENDNGYTRSVNDMMTRICRLDNRFYIFAGKKLYSANLSGKTYQITSSASYPMGIAVNDSRNLIYQNYNTPDTFEELDKLDYFNDSLSPEKGVNYNNYPDINYDEVINAKDYVMIVRGE